MSKFKFWQFMVTWAILEDEKRKQEERHHQRQESKNISQQIRKRNVSNFFRTT